MSRSPWSLLLVLPLSLVAACGGGHDHDQTATSVAAQPASPAALSGAAGETVTVTDGWIRAMPPGMSVAGGYFTLHNPTSAPLRLMGLTSPVSPRVELHEMRTVDGMMQMRELTEGLLVDPGSHAVLAPGGLHLMLFDIAEPLQEGASVDLTLRFEQGEPLTVTVPVRRAAPTGGDAHHGHH